MMKKIIYTLVFSIMLVSGLVIANREINKEATKKPKTISIAESNVEMKKWEVTPQGILYKKWEASPAGKKVYAASEKIENSVKDFTNMEGVVTSLSLPSGSILGFGVMVKINNDDYILSFGLDKPKEFEQLHNLKVDDKIIIKSHFVSVAPMYSFPIVAGDYIEHNNKIIYKRALQKGGGC
jgi:hypothetical protein